MVKSSQKIPVKVVKTSIRQLGKKQRLQKIIDEYEKHGFSFHGYESATLEEYRNQNKCLLCGISGEKTTLCECDGYCGEKSKMCQKCMVNSQCLLCAYIDKNYEWCGICEEATIPKKNWAYSHPTEDCNICEDCVKNRIQGWKFQRNKWIPIKVCVNCSKEATMINDQKQNVCKSCFCGQCDICDKAFNLKTMKHKSVNVEGEVVCNDCFIKWSQEEHCLNYKSYLKCQNIATMTNEKAERVCESCFFGYCKKCYTDFNNETFQEKTMNTEGRIICKTCFLEANTI